MEVRRALSAAGLLSRFVEEGVAGQKHSGFPALIPKTSSMRQQPASGSLPLRSGALVAQSWEQSRMGLGLMLYVCLNP